MFNSWLYVLKEVGKYGLYDVIYQTIYNTLHSYLLFGGQPNAGSGSSPQTYSKGRFSYFNDTENFE